MNDFISKYKNSMKGVSPKQQKKEEKKSISKALNDTFKLAMTGQVAGLQHQGVMYLMMRQDIFNDVIKNGGKLLITEEQKEFHQYYQILLHMMQSLNMEDEKESELFAEIDQFTFDFSQFMNDQNETKKRREILKDFKETIERSELLVSMENNLRNQFFPDENKKEEVVNNGKLT